MTEGTDAPSPADNQVRPCRAGRPCQRSPHAPSLRRAQVVGVELPALSSYYRGTARKRGFLFGYAGIAENEINSGLARLDRMFRES